MESPAKKVSVAYGIYLGVALILITVLAYAFDLALFTKWWFGILIILFTIIMGGFAASKAKKASTELFSFKKSLWLLFSNHFHRNLHRSPILVLTIQRGRSCCF